MLDIADASLPQVLGQVGFMPVLVLAAQLCPEARLAWPGLLLSGVLLYAAPAVITAALRPPQGRTCRTAAASSYTRAHHSCRSLAPPLLG